MSTWKNMVQVAVLVAVACAFFSGQARAENQGFVLVSSTIGPIDSGIVAVLEDQFEKESGIRVRHVGAGTGAALKIATGCSVDLVMVHSKPLEEKFVKDGYGTARIPLMYNDFVIVGPAADPAGIRGMKTAVRALRAISDRGALFISRGDRSGTHMAEAGLWEKAGTKPAAPWYTVYEKGAEGNVSTLLYTDQKGAYTVIDRATYLTIKDRIRIGILVEGDEALLNHISLIPVNAKKCSRVNSRDAVAFVKWLTDPEKGQKIIEDYGRDKYGQPLFFPESDEYKAKFGK